MIDAKTAKLQSAKWSGLDHDTKTKAKEAFLAVEKAIIEGETKAKLFHVENVNRVPLAALLSSLGYTIQFAPNDPPNTTSTVNISW